MSFRVANWLKVYSVKTSVTKERQDSVEDD
jgi:hypothetical protein